MRDCVRLVWFMVCEGFWTVATLPFYASIRERNAAQRNATQCNAIIQWQKVSLAHNKRPTQTHKTQKNHTEKHLSERKKKSNRSKILLQTPPTPSPSPSPSPSHPHHHQ